MSLWKDEENKIESVLLADEVKAKGWLAAHKGYAIALVIGLVLGAVLRSCV